MKAVHDEIIAEYRQRRHRCIDAASYGRRSVRLRRAWELTQRLEDMKSKAQAGSPLRRWLAKMTVWGRKLHKESFLYLVKDAVQVVPFEQLNRFRSIEDGTVVWRHQIALHPMLFLADGISISEVQNSAGATQRKHNHAQEERVISLAKNMVIQQLNGDGSVVQHEVKAGFADMIQVSSRLFHRLVNPDSRPSADFTLKTPLLQLVQDREKAEELSNRDIRVTSIHIRPRETGGQSTAISTPTWPCI